MTCTSVRSSTCCGPRATTTSRVRASRAIDDYVFGVFLVPICVREEDRVFYQEVDLVATRERS